MLSIGILYIIKFRSRVVISFRPDSSGTDLEWTFSGSCRVWRTRRRRPTSPRRHLSLVRPDRKALNSLTSRESFTSRQVSRSFCDEGNICTSREYFPPRQVYLMTEWNMALVAVGVFCSQICLQHHTVSNCPRGMCRMSLGVTRRTSQHR